MRSYSEKLFFSISYAILFRVELRQFTYLGDASHDVTSPFFGVQLKRVVSIR